MHVAAKNYEQAHTHTRDNHSNDNNKIIRSAEAHTYNNYILYLCKTAQHEAHAKIDSSDYNYLLSMTYSTSHCMSEPSTNLE